MKLTRSQKVFQVFNYIILGIIALATLYPFLDVIKVSISTPADASRMSLTLWPGEFTFAAYKHVFANQYIWIGYKNTFLRIIVGISIQMALTILTAYPLSKKDLPCRYILTLLITFTMFFSGGLIPSYLLVRYLNMRNTIWALVLPGAINTFSMLIMRNYFMSLPKEIDESAKLDGAGDLKILIKIVLPLSVPILAVVGLWGIVAHWNAWFDCLIYITDSKKYVLQAILRKIVIDATPQFDQQGSGRTDMGVNIAAETIKCASIIVATLPVLIIYPFLQKYFVQGIMVGSLKG